MDEGNEHHFLFVQKLTEKALDMADLTFDRAFAIDNSIIAKEVEDYAFMSLMEKFYKKVYEDELLRPLFSKDYERNVSNLTDFVYQRCGGNTFYSDRNGIPNLPQRHQDYEITQPMVEKWLHLMEDAFDESDADFSEDQRVVLLDFMRFQGYYILVWGQAYRELISKGGMF